MNREVIAVDQDPLGIQGHRVRKNGDTEVWAKRLQHGARAVVLLNRATAERQISVSWKEIGLSDSGTASVRDLWQSKNLGNFTDSFVAIVEPHSVIMVIVTPGG